MSSVTGRIREIKQPRGGYLKPSQFETIPFNDGIILNENENIHHTVMGLTVDYLTRFIIGTDKKETFQISLNGAKIAELLGIKKSVDVAEELLNNINGIDDNSIVSACKLVTFDVYLRNPMGAFFCKNYQNTNPDKDTIQNIQTLIKRGIKFFEKYGPVTKAGFTFESENTDDEANKRISSGKGSYGGYTATVDSGDGDFLTVDTLWDFKVSKRKPTSQQTLQLLMYWIMGQHSGQKIYKNITKLGIFNPRLNIVYLLNVNNIPNEVIQIVEQEIICYE